MSSPITVWYRNAGRRSRYHLPADGWIRSGKARCGASIPRPGFELHAPVDKPMRPFCEKCRARIDGEQGNG